MHEIYECTQMAIMDTEVGPLKGSGGMAYSGLYSARLHWELTLKKENALEVKWQSVEPDMSSLIVLLRN